MYPEPVAPLSYLPPLLCQLAILAKAIWLWLNIPNNKSRVLLNGKNGWESNCYTFPEVSE